MSEEISTTQIAIKPSSNVASIQRPAINLEKAMKYANDIFNGHSFNAFNDELLAQILGHKTISSSTYGRNKGALTHYGLIEKVVEGKNKGLLRLSGLYKEYATEVDENKKNSLLNNFFNSPTIFKNIQEWVPDLSTASKAVVVMHIMRNKDVDKSIAEETADTFLESYEYYKKNNNSSSRVIEEIVNEQQEETVLENKLVDVSQKLVLQNKKTISNFSHVYPLSNERALVVSFPSELNDLTEEEIDDITDMLNLLITKLKRSKTKLTGIKPKTEDTEKE